MVREGGRGGSREGPPGAPVWAASPGHFGPTWEEGSPLGAGSSWGCVDGASGCLRPGQQAGIRVNGEGLASPGKTEWKEWRIRTYRYAS